MVLEGAYIAFCGIASVQVLGYELLSDLPVFLDEMLVFYADLVIKNLEIELVA